MVTAALPDANVRQDAFSPQQFVTFKGVPVFAEHETVASNGRRLKFGQRELKQIVDRCNRRIQETGDYAAVTIGHTPEPGQGKPQPPCVGFAGPFRLGLIGKPGQRKRYAILCDFHLYRDKAQVLREYPRRSPELWLEERFEDMYLDPISLISEPPRLDMGLLYSASRQGGRIVEKYAAAAPAAMNTFIPSHAPAATKQYAAPGQKPGGRLMALSPDDVRAIVDAISQLDWVQWVKQKMEEEEVGGEESGELPAEAEGNESPVGAGAMGAEAGPPPMETGANALGAEAEEGVGESPESGPPMPPPGAAAGAPEASGPPPEGPPGEDSEKQKLKEYSAQGTIAGSSGTAGCGDVEGNVKPRESGVIDKKYAAGANPTVTGKGAFHPKPDQFDRNKKYSASEAALAAEVGELRKQLCVERYARVNAERRQQLEAMRQHLVFDVDEELEFCSAEVMPERGHFEKYAASLGNKCVRIPHGDLPTQFLSMPAEAPTPKASGAAAGPPRAAKEKYAKELSDRAFKYCEDRAKRGVTVDYVDVLNRLHRGEALPA